MPTPYPEHEKLKKVSEQSQSIGEFLDWLQNQRQPTLQLCEATDDFWRPFMPAGKTITRLLAEYFDIDEDKLEEEKLQMLEEQRLLNQRRRR